MSLVSAGEVSNHGITVSIAAIVRDGHVFLSRRKQDAHQGGLWEFPGGKQELGESPLTALHRELDEELGIQIRRCRPLIQVSYDYPELSVRLDVWLVTEFDGMPRGREGQITRWVSIEDLSNYTFPKANRPIITALQLPDCYAITPDLQALPEMKAAIDRLMNSGCTLIQYRAPSLSHEDWYEAACYAIQTAGECRKRKVRIILNSSIQTAKELGADGVHLNVRRLAMRLGLERCELPQGFLIGASCHSEAELVRAQGLAVDFAVLSPVLPTLSHPEASTLGWSRFDEWLGRCNIPVYALGGMVMKDRERSRRSGGQGVAGISMFAAS